MVESPPPVAVLFVCLGNHCRSPAAQAIAETMLRDRTIARFDSAGIGRHHVGERPHPLSSTEGARRGYRLNHIGRQVHPDDFERFDLIVAMDQQNIDDLERMRGGTDLRTGHYATVEPHQLQLFRRWDTHAMPGDEDVGDPWDQGPAAYRAMYDVLERTMPLLLDHLSWLHREHP